MNSNKKQKTLNSFEASAAATGMLVPEKIKDKDIPRKVINLKRNQDNVAQNRVISDYCPNIGWMFYKNYFKGIDYSYIYHPDKTIKAKNAELIKNNNRKIIEETKWKQVNDSLGDSTQTIELKVTYPGLITGIGINHEAGIEGEFKLGLHFDYTYGQPIIHGSSVKGLLRSVFPSEKNDKHADAKLSFLRDTIGRILNEKDLKTAIRALEKEIFEGIRSDGSRIDIYHRDIFFDAIVIKPDPKQRVVESDSITPHGTNPLKNPVPLPFLKISPGCTIQFRFDLKPGILTVDEKIALFTEILRTLGIGAKTNVGYGQFEE